MARIIYSGIVTKISGSVGGTTFQSNAYGFTIKNKPNMVKPNTPFQQLRKLAFERATKAWSELTNAQRSNWNTWASTNPQYAKNNPSSVLSGFAVFVRSNVFGMIDAGLSNPIISSPSFVLVGSETVTYTITTALGVLSLDAAYVRGGTDLESLVYISRPFNDSQNFVGTTPRFIIALPNDNDTTVITTQYTNQFGAIPIAGQVVNVTTQFFNVLNGQVFAKSNQRVICS